MGNWTRFPDDPVVLVVECDEDVDCGKVEAVRATVFASFAKATKYGDVHDSDARQAKAEWDLYTGAGAGSAASATWVEGRLELRESAFQDRVATADHVVLVEIFFGHRAWSVYALLQWTPEGFIVLLRSYAVAFHAEAVQAEADGTEGGDGAAEQPLLIPCTLKLWRETRARERLFVTGGDSPSERYEETARELMLVEEFGQEMHRHANDDANVDGKEDYTVEHPPPNTTTHGDDVVVTTITAERRTTYVRMFPADLALSEAVAPDNRAGERHWVQWYPVLQHEKGHDPITGSKGGVPRAYAYLDWIAGNAPGRIEWFAIVSHAETDGAWYFGSGENGERSHFDPGGKGSGILPPFGKDARFWVTGCNADANKHGAPRNTIAMVEGAIRARIRLRIGLVPLIVSPWASAADPCLPDVQWLTKALFAMSDDGYAWQLPGESERAVMREAKPEKRNGAEILELRDEGGTKVKAHIDTLLAWADIESPSADECLAARAALQGIDEATAWSSFAAMKIDEQTVDDWIAAARSFIVPTQHYVANFVKLARAAGRDDILALGGNPGYGAEHLKVQIDLGDGPLEALAGEICAYFYPPLYSGWSRPWTIAFYRRFGLHVMDALGYFAYSALDDIDAPAFDHETLTFPEGPPPAEEGGAGARPGSALD